MDLIFNRPDMLWFLLAIPLLFLFHFFALKYIKVKGMSSHDMAKVVKDNWDEFRRLGIRRIEDPNDTASKWGKKGRDWLHMDTGTQYQMKGGILVPRTDLIVVNP